MSRRSLCALVAVAIRRAYRAAIAEELVNAGYGENRARIAARRMVRNRGLSIGEALA